MNEKGRQAMNKLLDAALAYAAAEYPIFPCAPDKSPYTKHGFKDATTDPEQIKKWWTEFPHAMIGMPTGEESGVAVLDLDVKKGKDGFKAVPDWETRSPVIARTMSGGAHLYFKYDEHIVSSTDRIAKGVDTQGKGKYVIVPPSEGYRWHGSNDLNHLPNWPDDMRLPERNRDNGIANEEILARNQNECFMACAFVPNDEPGWIEWTNNIAIPIYAAFDGSDQGLEAFHHVSKKSEKYTQHGTNKKWRELSNSKPDKKGAGSLYHMANEACPNWRDIVDEWLAEKSGESLYDYYDRVHVDESYEKQNEKQNGKDHAAPPPKSDAPPPKKKSALLVSSADFVDSFVPPDYLIEGLIQRRFLYSLTAQTNTGKTTVALLLAALVAEGKPLGKREIESGKVLFFAGENPDDVRMRWIRLCEERNIDARTKNMVWIPGSFSLKKLASKLATETKDHGPFALIVIDTSAVYFEGDDENSNTQLGDYARKTLRPLVNLHGGPTILVLCHPIKNASNEYLVPRGGGAFVNEVDGNLVLMVKSEAPKVVELHWHGKFRGADFAPIPFRIVAGACKDLRDSKGRELWTVTARTMTDKESEESDEISIKNQDALIAAMKSEDGRSFAELCRALGWYYSNGTDPNKSLVTKTMRDLESRRLVKKEGNRWSLTQKGRQYSPGPEGQF